MSNYPWKEEMMRDIQNSAIVKFAAGVKNAASGLLSKGWGFIYRKSVDTTTTQSTGITDNEGDVSMHSAHPTSQTVALQEIELNSTEDTNTLTLKTTVVSDGCKEIVEVSAHSDPTLEPNQIIIESSSCAQHDVQTEESLDTKEAHITQVDVLTNTSIIATPPSETHKRPIKELDEENNKQKKKKKKKNMDNSPFIINDYENLVVGLFPAVDCCYYCSCCAYYYYDYWYYCCHYYYYYYYDWTCCELKLLKMLR